MGCPAQQVRLKIALGHALGAGVGMRLNPGAGMEIVCEEPVSGGKIVFLKYKLQGNATVPVVNNGQSHCVGRALLRKMRAGTGISQIAAVLQDVLVRLGVGGGGRGAAACPSRSQGQARGMRPEQRVEALIGKEKGTGHEGTF